MSVAVPSARVSDSCVELRWSLLSASSAERIQDVLLSVIHVPSEAPSGSANGCEWTIVVRDPTTSVLRLDLQPAGTVRIPATATLSNNISFFSGDCLYAFARHLLAMVVYVIS